MSPGNQLTTKKALRSRGLAAIAAVITLWTVAGVALWIHLAIASPARRVHIRWAADVSETARTAAEREWSLVAGVDEGDRTWRYLLEDRTERNVAAILTSRRVADTAYLDRDTLRVRLDRPDGSQPPSPAEAIALAVPGMWELLAADRMPLAVGLLVIAGLAVASTTWRSIGATLAHGGAQGYRWLNALDRDDVRARIRGLELPVALVTAALVLVPLLVYGPFEEEVVQHSIFPNQLFYRALFSGRWLYWVNDLGFGTPLPGDRLLYHPIFGPLAAFTSLRVTLSAVWIAHTALMTVAFLRLTAVSGARSPLLRLLLLICYLTSVVSLKYFYDTDWVTAVITWSLYPVVLLALRTAVLDGKEHSWRTTIGLAVIFGFWILNGHPGSIAPILSVLVIYALVAAPMDRRVYLGLCAAGILCGAIAAAHVYNLAHEALLFPDTTSFNRDGMPMGTYGAWALGFGAAFAIATAGAIGAVYRSGDRHLRGCLAALAASIVLSQLPRPVVQWLSPSGASLFGDPFIFFGLIAGGAALQCWFDSPRVAMRRAAWVLVALQVVQQAGIISRSNIGRSSGLLFYRYQGQPVGLGADLVEAAGRFGPRVFASPQIDFALRGSLSPFGVHFSSDLLLLGLAPVNGWFKNVSMSPLQPPESMMESVISGDLDVIGNHRLLDVLGIDLVLLAAQEGDVPTGLQTVRRLPIRSERLSSDLIIAANPDAWPRAVLVDPAAATLQLPPISNCGHRAALCRDYSPLSSLRLPGDVTVRSREDEYTATFAPASNERLLFISSLYRAEWRAASSTGVNLPIVPVADAFMGVRVPPGVTSVTARYTPRVQQALTWFSTTTFTVLVVVWGWLWLRTWRGRDRTRVAAVLSNSR